MAKKEFVVLFAMAFKPKSTARKEARLSLLKEKGRAAGDATFAKIAAGPLAKKKREGRFGSATLPPLSWGR